MNKILNTEVVTPVSTEVISLAQAKARLRVDSSDDNDTITAIISEARSLIEGFCGISIGEQERAVKADVCELFQIPYGPVTSVDAVNLYDSTDDDYTDELTAGDDYRIINDLYKPYKAGETKIEYTAGYTSESIPTGLKNAWYSLIAHLYENRGDGGIPVDIRQKLNPYTRNFGI